MMLGDDDLELVQIVRTLDENLYDFVQQFGTFIYIVLFLVVFAKTAFIITPFMPGDSVVFASGTLAAVGILQIEILILLFLIAAISGDSQNFGIGRYLEKN